MKKYDKYKPSGVEWIGEIPEHWELERTKWIFNESKSRNRDLKYEDEDLLSVSEYYGVAKRAEKIDNNDILNRAESLAENKVVKKGELVINIMLAWKKGLGVSFFDGIVSPSYCVYKLISENADPNYFHYLYRTNLYAESFRRFSRGIIESRLRLYTEELFNITTILPLPEEQTAIANYLDDKTAKIDTLVEKKKKLVELLKEERTAVINEAVTKGLNHDLPDYLDKKNHGNPLIKDNQGADSYPEHWQVKKLKYILKIKSGEGIKSEDINFDGTFPVYGGNGIMGYTENFNSDKFDIIIGRVGAKCGNVRLVKGKKWISDNALVVDLFKGYDYDFMSTLLESINLNSLANQNAQPLITGTLVRDKIVAIPPGIEEQSKIVQHIEAETKRIDSTISGIEKQIELLQEYRTALISEVVTGKICVYENYINHENQKNHSQKSEL